MTPATTWQTQAAASHRNPLHSTLHHGHFANDPSLTQREIDTLVNWVDSGAAEGDPQTAPPPVQWPEGWRSKPDVVVSLPAVPAKGYIEWTDMIIPNPFQTDTWVTSVEIRPGVPAVVYHTGIRFTPHKNDVQYYVPTWSDFRRDEAGYAIPSQGNLETVTYCKEEQTKLFFAVVKWLWDGTA